MKKMKKNYNNSGITLVEILVYTSIFAILAIGIFSLLNWIMSSNNKAKVMAETLDNANRAMEIMVSEIKSAKDIYSPTTTATQLSLETTKYLPEGEYTSYIDFYLCGTRLCFKKESQDPIILTSDSVEISSLTFTKVASGTIPSVQIDLTMKYKNPSGKPEYQASVHLTSTASVRSY
jgi:type II secretory pathway pseudopilin PulG